MSLHDITEKISADARSEAKAFQKSAAVEVENIARETERRTRELRREQDAQLSEVEARAHRERLALYRQKIKARLDKEKRAVLEQAFSKALEKVASDAAHMETLLDHAAKQLALRKETDVEVVVSKNARELVERSVGKHMPKGVRYIEEEGRENGCIIRVAGAEYELTAENMVRDAKRALEPEVATILFQETKSIKQ